MSCSSCGCSPCRSGCDCECDPAQESIASQLENFQTAFFGTITKSCVNGEVVWSLPCDLDGGIPGYPRLAGEGIACYLLRIWTASTACNCSFLQLTDTPDTYVGQAGKVVAVNGTETGLEFIVPAAAGGCRGFPSAQAVWLDLDAALQTPCGQPAFTTAQAAYNAADALAILSGLPVVIMVGRGGATEFGGILTGGGADWNPNVSISGLGHNISALDFITTLDFAGGDGGDVVLTINDCDIFQGIGTQTMDVTGAFNAGNVTIDGNGSTIGTIYAAAPAGGGNGGSVTIVDGSTNIFGNILTTVSRAGKTGGAILIGRTVRFGFAATTGIGAGDAGAVTLGVGAVSLNGIDAYADSGNGATVTLEADSIVNGAVTTLSSNGNGGNVLLGKGAGVTGAVSVQSAAAGNAGNITGEGANYAGNITGTSVGGNASTINFQAGCRFENIVLSHVGGTAGSLTLRLSRALTIDGTADTSGTGATLALEECVLEGLVDISGLNGASGGNANIDGGHYIAIHSNAVGVNGGALTCSNIVCDSITATSDTAGNGGTVSLRQSTVNGFVDVHGVNGSNGGIINTNASSIGNSAIIGTDTGVGGQLNGFSGSFFEHIDASTGANAFRSGVRLDNCTVNTTLDGTATGASTGASCLITGCYMLDVNLTSPVGISGSLVATNSRFENVNVSATTGQAGTIWMRESLCGDANASHVAGSGGSVKGENSSFSSVTITSDTSGQSAALELLNCYVSGTINSNSTNGATTSNATIRSGAYGAITFDCTGGSVSNQFNIFSADVGNISGNNDSGTQAGFLTAVACNIGSVSLLGTTGSAGGFIQADSCRFIDVDTSGAISGQIHMRNCRVNNLQNSLSCNQKLDNCVIFGHVLTAGFLSQFVKCSFQAQAATDCVDELTGDGAYFVDCSFQSDPAFFCIDSTVPHTVKMYGTSLSRTNFSPTVTAFVGGLTIDPAF